MTADFSRNADALHMIAASPEQEKMFRDVVATYCELHGIECDADRAEIVRRVTVLAIVGIRTRERLLVGLEANRKEDGRRELHHLPRRFLPNNTKAKRDV